MVVAGVAAPLVRKRVSAPPLLVQAVAFGAPLGLCVAVRRSRTRDVAACALQMWAYLAAYKSPHDDPDAQQRRVHVDYPIGADRVLGLGELPSVRLQRALARERRRRRRSGAALDRVLVWAHWSWFAVPHGSLLYILAAPPRALPARGRAHLRGVRHRRQRLLAGARPRRPGTPPTPAAGEAALAGRCGG